MQSTGMDPCMGVDREQMHCGVCLSGLCWLDEIGA